MTAAVADHRPFQADHPGGLALVCVLAVVPSPGPLPVVRVQLLVTPQHGAPYLTVQDVLGGDHDRLRPGSLHVAGRYAVDDPGLVLFDDPSPEHWAEVHRIPTPPRMVPRWWAGPRSVVAA